MTEGLMSELKAQKNRDTIIMVAGVGGAGGNAVNHMWSQGIHGVEFMVCNTDSQALDISPVELKIQLGRDGLGAGNDPSNGRNAAVESLEEIRQQLQLSGVRMLFLTAGMGGGTGTGASPVIAKLAKEMGILTVAIVTTPCVLEGHIRYEQAFVGLSELQENVDSLLVISNDSIMQMYGKLPLKHAFGKANDILASAARGIAEIITVKSDLVNVDFADVSKVMTNSGRAHMSVAVADGENRAEEAARASLESPLLNHKKISGAKNILLNILVEDDSDLVTDEVQTILKYIQSRASVRDENGQVHDANIIWGTGGKAKLGTALELVIVATGFGDDDKLEDDYRNCSTNNEPANDTLNPLEATKPTTLIDDNATVQVILGAKSVRYNNIESLMSQPAYLTRNSQLIENYSEKESKDREPGDNISRL